MAIRLIDTPTGRIVEAHRRATDALVALQNEDGHWRGELQGDSILESEYLLMKLILRQEDEPMADGRSGPVVLAKIATQLRSLQRDDGETLGLLIDLDLIDNAPLDKFIERPE